VDGGNWGKAKRPLAFALVAGFLGLCRVGASQPEEAQGQGPLVLPKTLASSERKAMETSELSPEHWKQCLAPEVYRVTRAKGTEPPFSGKYYHHHEPGYYLCTCCGAPLFSSEAKFDSGTGWPSFYRELRSNAIRTETDRSHGMVREEILCARCGAHLGHRFPDGPPPTGLRYCVNSLSLRFCHATPWALSRQVRPERLERAIFAGGCFWGVEAAFRKVKGVAATCVGFTGGHAPSPSYRLVCSGTTGHAEAVELLFDPGVTSYRELLSVFEEIHDPTSYHRQGADVGEQYRSAIFYCTLEQKEEAQRWKEEAARRFGRPIATEILSAGPFYEAEEYHQRYYEKHGLTGCGR
jgi:peptide methionine sulfoxide reductase msrA/msrB